MRDRLPGTAATGRRGWRPDLLTAAIAALAVLGLGAALYPAAAQWLSSYNQAQVVERHLADGEDAHARVPALLAEARAYNEALTAGRILVRTGEALPVSTSAGRVPGFSYPDLLRAADDDVLGRIRVPTAGIDLPIHHGTSESVLLRGAGHLEGTHLPVGGAGTRSVITAHRGLAEAQMFTNLDQVGKGDVFSVVIFDEVLSYEVVSVETIDPDDTDALRPVPGRDLVTLITCTPLGVNTQRIVITGERLTPAPPAEVAAAFAPRDIPGFPWWLIWGAAGLLTITAYVTVSGIRDARVPSEAP